MEEISNMRDLERMKAANLDAADRSAGDSGDAEETIVINDGRRKVTIRNQNGDVIGSFRFNPTDINIVNRYNESVSKFEDIVKPLANYDIKANGEGDGSEAVAALDDAEAKLIELMDYVLDGKFGQAFFGKTHAFAGVEIDDDVKFYCEVAFDAVGQYISNKFDMETRKLERRLNKHTHGYKTGKHAKGWQ